MRRRHPLLAAFLTVCALYAAWHALASAWLPILLASLAGGLLAASLGAVRLAADWRAERAAVARQGRRG